MPVTIKKDSIVFPSGSITNGLRGAYKNLIMNGDFRVHQRVTSTYALTSSTDGRFFDRWRCFLPSGRTATLSRMTSATGGAGGNPFPGYFFRRTIDTVSTTSTDPDIIATQWIDSQTLSSLNIATEPPYTDSGQSSFIISFWVRSSIIGNASVAVELKFSASDTRWAFCNYYIARANVWEKKRLLFNTTGSYGALSGVPSRYPTDMYVHFVGYPGPENNSGTNIISYNYNWGGERFFLHSSRKLGSTRRYVWNPVTQQSVYVTENTNFHNTAGATFDLSRIQLQAANASLSYIGFSGDSSIWDTDDSLEYEFIPYALELKRCQKYFQKSYSQHIAPGSANDNGANIQRFGTATNWSGYYPVQWRGGRMAYQPSVVIYDLAGNIGALTRDGTHNVHSGTIQLDAVSETAMMLYSSDTFPNHYGLWFHWIAFADY